MNPLIRAVTADDVPAIHELRKQPLVRRYTPAMPSDRLVDYLAKWGPNDHVMVALSGGKDSYTLLHILTELTRAQYPSVRLTAVHLDQRQPGYDGRGAGQALMRALLELADKWIGLIRVDLEADATNERAIAMYRRFGFVDEGIMKKAYFVDGEYHDCLFMARVR